MVDFDTLKKNRQSRFDDLKKAAEELKSNQASGDDRFWKLTVDKTGSGSAIIRFLDSPQGENVPFVRLWDHGFKGPGGWYIEKCLTSLGQDDPACDHNSKLWNSGIEKNKSIARDQKRRLSYISNIKVIKDPSAPENDGKVFLFRFGKKIFDKINDKMYPEFEDENAFNPFDLWDGADFRLRCHDADGYRTYEKSSFDSQSPISSNDEEIEKIWKSEYSLSEFLDPKNFKPYVELQKKLNRVLGLEMDNRNVKNERAEDAPVWTPPASESKEEKSDYYTGDSKDFDDDNSMEYFQSLVDSD